ncbi:DNA polymerase III subunit epsilon [Brevundimonas sp. 2R-24]|uniref:DNA polymerase III subunit epsilon n=1 Tax=Peiella sedimenti TaxID=3061083 RepID=A0ABT8SKS1_9CAUL|nr:DNA polymerase III subunit epsilon [Caulobacteraceae bacterium XZ-24]
MAREIVLDTETTGLDPRAGHRLIEIACIEVEDLLPTGRVFHRYVNPQRIIEADAIRVHGITNERVAGEPLFSDICEELLDFLAGDPIVAHNAAFDRGFINHELGLCGWPELHEDRWIDTLALAQKRFPGMANSLDALCRRFKVSLAERTLHGALIDTRLLASVYLELRGGKERGLDLSVAAAPMVQAAAAAAASRPAREWRPRSTTAERERHAAFLADVLKDRSLWAAYDGEAQATRAA